MSPVHPVGVSMSEIPVSELPTSAPVASELPMSAPAGSGLPASELPGLDRAFHHDVRSVLTARSTCLLQAMELNRAGDLGLRQVVELVVESVVSAVRSVPDID